MSGVGYYEMDSVVEACKEYIKAQGNWWFSSRLKMMR